jgi:cytochrome c oxidase subunit 3
MSASSHAIANAHGHVAEGAEHGHVRTNTGLQNGILGIMFFLVSEMGLFGTLIFMYLYERRSAPVWPPVGFDHFEWQLPTVNTVVLLSSGVTMHFAFQSLRQGKMSRMITLLIITIVLGLAFLGGQAYEYSHIQHGVALQGSVFGATFFTLTGLHGIHVSVGVILLLTLLVATLRKKIGPQKTVMANVITLYWHFVDAVWVILFALFYLTVQ